MFVKGYVQKKIFVNQENNYSIYSIELENKTELTIVGYLPNLSLDILYEFEVEEVNHPKYGIQYNVIGFKKSLKQNEEGLIAYLSSDLFTGIGPVKAKRIIDNLGDDAIEKILADKNVLRKLGFNPLQTERLYQQLYQNKTTDDTLVGLFSYGLSANLSMKLFNYYQEDTIKIITNNPYQLIDDIYGIDFIKADAIALKIGFKKDDPKRIEAAIIYAVKTIIFSSGDTYLNEFEFYQAINKVLGEESLKTDIDESIEQLLLKGKLIKTKNNFTLDYIKETEFNLGTQLLSFIENKPINTNIDFLIKKAENKLGITYTKQQKRAITEAINKPISVITGGPGTGKTTVLSGLLEVYSELNGLLLDVSSITEKIAICAPTGRAARKMSEVINIKSFTIHKLLGYDHEGKFFYNENNLLPQLLFIIDEASMVDIFLAEQLFKSISKKAKIIIVGDKDQLPSVGPGQVLADIIFSDVLPVIYLDEVHRQAKNSSIIALANRINNQQIDSLSYDSTEDLVFYKEDEKSIINHLIKLADACVFEGYNIIDDFQILIPMYKGFVGIDRVNQAFQNHLHGDNLVFAQNGAMKFFLGDKVMQLVNAPDKGVMNGDIGIVVDIYQTINQQNIITVKFDDAIVRYEPFELDELTLAYAISIHKSQGSEYKIVFMPLVASHVYMLRKELIYTGITRAKNHLYILGDLSLIEKASIHLNEKRKTYLKDILRNNT